MVKIHLLFLGPILVREWEYYTIKPNKVTIFWMATRFSTSFLKKKFPSPDTEEYIEGILNELNNNLTGYPERGELDSETVQIKDYPLSVKFKSGSLDMVFLEGILDNLLKDKVKNVKQLPEFLVINAEVTLPNVLISGKYKMNGTVLNDTDVSGSGNFLIKARDLVAEVKLVNLETFQVNRAEIFADWNEKT